MAIKLEITIIFMIEVMVMMEVKGWNCGERWLWVVFYGTWRNYPVHCWEHHHRRREMRTR